MPTTFDNPFLVLAPSAAGKTHFIRSQHAKGHDNWIDGDTIIANSIGWPSDPDWHRKPEAADIHSKIEAALISWHRTNPAAIVLFNGHISKPSLVLAVVLPPQQVIERNVASRKASEPTRAFPANMEEAWDNWRSVLAFAYANDLPILTSFEQLVTPAPARSPLLFPTAPSFNTASPQFWETDDGDDIGPARGRS